MKGRQVERALLAPILLSLVLVGCGRSDAVAVAHNAATTGGPTSGETETETSETETTFDTESSETTFDDSTTTTGIDPLCGNAVLDPGEECDPGDALIGPGQDCLDGCINNVCGDGDLGPAEQCDDGNDIDDDGCRNDCVPSSCNDGITQEGEECDDGNFDDNDACLSDCTIATCGDGFVRDGFEECDDGEEGNSPFGFCTPLCTVNVCGDGFQRFDEQCDPGEDQIGPGLECRDGCILNVCGDGDPWLGEACDDGNDDNTDACVNCNTATCGDGFVFPDEEECDDGDFDDFDSCHNDCSFHRVTKVSLGGNHTCALFDSGLTQCWGNGNNGRTGHGDEENYGDNEPASTAGFLSMGGPVTDINAAVGHTCYSDSDNRLRCFGRALEGQLGYGNINDLGDDELPGSLPVLALPDPTTLFNARGGSFHNCARSDVDGTVRCWGRQDSFQLGIPGLVENIGDDETAAATTPIVLGPETVDDIALGSAHSCVLLDTGGVRCWGLGADGALGYGNSANIGDDEDPATANNVPVGAGVVRLTAGWFHTCVITDVDDVRCWGRGAAGRLGYGSTVSIGVAQTAADVGGIDLMTTATPVEIAAGLGHSCALFDDGTVRCWGANTSGQLGYANTASIGDNEPAGSGGDVPLGGPAVAIAADGNHTCAIMESNGAVRCWGNGGYGRLGYGNTNNVGDDEPPSAAGDVPLLQ